MDCRNVAVLHNLASKNFQRGRWIDQVHYQSEQARREDVPIAFNNLVGANKNSPYLELRMCLSISIVQKTMPFERSIKL